MTSLEKLRMRREARDELRATIDDLYYAASLYAESGDVVRAQQIETHVKALQALLFLGMS